MDKTAWAATFAEALQVLCNRAEPDLPLQLADLAGVAEEAAADPGMHSMDPCLMARMHWDQR